MEKFEETLEKWTMVNKELWEDCVAYLKNVLSTADGNMVVIDNDNDVYAMVSYDGGAHPEYATNLCSSVHSVYMMNDTIYLDIEECDNYEYDRINAIELYYVCDAVKQSLAIQNESIN